MSLAQTRSVMVDDTSSSIQYSGSWFADPAAHDIQGPWASSLYGTLHGTRTNGSLSFSFSGNKVMVAGASRNTTAGATNPTWTCLIDGVSIESQAFPGPINRWPLCENDNLSDGPHNITVSTLVGPDQIFWFDYIQYAPSFDVPLDNAAVYIDSTDPQMQYGSGQWAPVRSGMGTNQPGATFSLTFYGISLTWFGIIPSTTVALTPATGTYSVDGESLVPFPLNGLPPNTSDNYNQVFLQTPQLAPGLHKLEVTYMGNSGSVPLTIDDVIVQNGTTTFSATSPNATSPDITDQNGTGNTQPHRTSNNIGVIAGGVAGGVGLIAIVIALFCLSNRWRSRARQHMKERFDIDSPGRYVSMTSSPEYAPIPFGGSDQYPRAGTDSSASSTSLENSTISQSTSSSSNKRPLFVLAHVDPVESRDTYSKSAEHSGQMTERPVSQSTTLPSYSITAPSRKYYDT